jgi:hypothetical protein
MRKFAAMGPAKSRGDVVVSITPRRKHGELEDIRDENARQGREIDDAIEPRGRVTVGELWVETGFALERVSDHVKLPDTSRKPPARNARVVKRRVFEIDAPYAEHHHRCF